MASPSAELFLRLVPWIALLLCAGAPPASAVLRVVASTPDVADVTRRIGGERVSVTPIASGAQDPHKVPVKPSFVTKLNRADALVVQGLGLEHAFIPPLLEAARNPKILPGAPGYIDAALHVTPLEVPSSQSRAQGDLHALGNPHYNLDPERGKQMAQAIAEGLARLDPAGEAAYREGLARFSAEVDRRLAEWLERAAPLRGVKIVSHHDDLPYLAERFGLVRVGTLEVKPGVPPTPGHLEALTRLMQREQVRLIVHEVSYDPALARSLAQRTGARIATLSVMAGGLGEEGYLASIEANLEALLAALQGGSD